MRHLIRVPCSLLLLFAAGLYVSAATNAAEPAQAPQEASPDWNVLPPGPGNHLLLRNSLLRRAGEHFDSRRRELAAGRKSPEALRAYAKKKHGA